MLRDAPTAGGGRRRRRAPRDRVHYRPARAPIPAEPGRVLTVAAVSLSREADGMQWIWDDRIETGVALLKRVLYKRAHGEKSAVFACAFAEIVYALGAAGGFPNSGPPPRFRGGSDWDDYFKRNRTTAQRWCQRAQASGLLAVVGENDNTGQWWRVLVRVLAVSPADVAPERLDDTRDRVKGYAKRRERSDRRGVQRDLRELAAGAEQLTAAEKKRRRLLSQEASARRASHLRELLRQPKEAEPPTGASANQREVQTYVQASTSHRRRGHAPGIRSLRSGISADRQRPHADNAHDPWTPTADNVTEEKGHSTRAAAGDGSPSDSPRGGRSGRLQGSAAPSGPPAHLNALTAQIAAIAPTSTQMTPAALRAVVIGWWQLCRGLPETAAAVTDAIAEAIDSASWLRLHVARYERLAAHRPAGWPASGAAAMLRSAAILGLPVATTEASRAFEQLLTLMAADERGGGRGRTALGEFGPPRVPEGFESAATMRRRLTEQLTAAGDTIEAYPSLRAAEQAAIEHERAGRLPAGPDIDWQLPWNRDRLPTLWPSPTAQLRWRRKHLPLSPIISRPDPHADRLINPAYYAAAVDRIRGAERGIRVSANVAEDLVHAFHAERYGVDGAIAKAAWRPRCALQNIRAVVDAYEALPVEVLPPGWPTSGLAALLHLATWRDPGSTTLDGKPVQMIRPEHLPMALGRLKAIITEIRHHLDRDPRIERARRRGGQPRLSRRRREAAEQAQAAAHRAEHPPKLTFRFPGAGEQPPITEGPRDTYERIRRQLLLCGDHPADYPSLEDAELALIDLETAGRLPAGAGASPSACRQQRLDRVSGPVAVAAAEWEHLAAAATDMLGATDAARLAEIQPVSVHDGRLVLAADTDTASWAKRIQLPRLLEHVARQLDVAHSVAFIAPEHASAFRPSAELVGPADYRAARGDRYLVERTTRYAVGAAAQLVEPEAMPNLAPRRTDGPPFHGGFFA